MKDKGLDSKPSEDFFSWQKLLLITTYSKLRYVESFRELSEPQDKTRKEISD